MRSAFLSILVLAPLLACKPEVTPAASSPAALGCQMNLSTGGVGPSIYKQLIDTSYYRSEFICPFDWQNDGTVRVFTYSDAVESRCGASEFAGVQVTKTEMLSDRVLAERMAQCLIIGHGPAPDHRTTPTSAFVWRISEIQGGINPSQDLAILNRGIESYVQKSGLPIYNQLLGPEQLCLEVDADAITSPRASLEALGFSTDIQFTEEPLGRSKCSGDL